MPLNHFVTLGRSGLRVSSYCLGTMTFGEDFGWGASPEESFAMLDEVTSTLIGARRLDQLKANLDSLDVTLSSGQISRLTGVSKPRLNFPAENNKTLAPMLAFPGTTVDGRTVLTPDRLSE